MRNTKQILRRSLCGMRGDSQSNIRDRNNGSSPYLAADYTALASSCTAETGPTAAVAIKGGGQSLRNHAGLGNGDMYQRLYIPGTSRNTRGLVLSKRMKHFQWPYNQAHESAFWPQVGMML